VALPVKTPGEGSRIYTTTWDANEVDELEAAPSSWIAGTLEIRGSWVTAKPGQLAALGRLLAAAQKRQPAYQVRRGVCTDLNGVFWLRLETGGDSPLVSQVAGVGKNAVRPYNGGRPFCIEREWLYPLLRGREVKPFCVTGPQLAILVPQRGSVGVSEEELRAYTYVWDYLRHYRTELQRRSSYRRYHSKRKAPYWSLWDCGPYTFGSPKVVLREIAGRAIAAVVGTLPPAGGPLGTALAGKPVVPDHKLFFVATDTEDEAHYLCAILNSSACVELLVAWSPKRHVSGRGLLDLLRPPRYDSGNARHCELSRLSMAAHAAGGRLDEKLAKELDRLAIEVLSGGGQDAGAASPE